MTHGRGGLQGFFYCFKNYNQKTELLNHHLSVIRGMKNSFLREPSAHVTFNHKKSQT